MVLLYGVPLLYKQGLAKTFLWSPGLALHGSVGMWLKCSYNHHIVKFKLPNDVMEPL